MDAYTMNLIAYETNPEGVRPEWVIEPAPKSRYWMDQTKDFAYRCMPMTMANHMGWVVRCPVDFACQWNGLESKDNMAFSFRDSHPDIRSQINNHFGFGIITFQIPWLFRTYPGDDVTPQDHKVGLLARGMPNEWIFNCHPLEGYVETWWLPFTFTMNWKVIEPGFNVMFRKGDPICFLQPYDLALLTNTHPEIRQIATDEVLARQYEKWGRSRERFNHDPRRKPDEWQRGYHKGEPGEGIEPVEGHMTHLKLEQFTHDERRADVPEKVERPPELGRGKAAPGNLGTRRGHPGGD